MADSAQRVRKAVFPAAGMGTRFLPATKVIPKEMLPIVDKPLIQYSVEEIVGSGIEEICVVTARGKTAIEDHFDFSVELEMLLRSRNHDVHLETVRSIPGLAHISYIRQKEALGLGHAVLTARGQVGDAPFAVVLPDDIIDSEVPCTRQLLDIYEVMGGPVLALMEVEREAVSAYGIAEVVPVGDPALGLCRILDVVEKPSPREAKSNLAVIGRYVLTPDIFDILETVSPGHGSEIQLTDGLRKLCKERDLYGLRFAGKRYDAGDKLGFLIANIEFALKRGKLGNDLRRYLEATLAENILEGN